MRLEKIRVLTKREYLARIKSKGFWIGILILPVFLALVTAVPALVMSKTHAEVDLVLVDTTGTVAPGLAERLERREGGVRFADFHVTVEPAGADATAQRAALDRRLLDERIDAWMWIDRAGLDQDRVEFHARNVSNTLTQAVLSDAVSAEVRETRLTEAGYDPAKVRPLLASIDLDTVKVSAEGSRSEAGEAGFFLAYGLFFLLYMVLLLWGQQVLQGVLEEKTSRVVEVVASSARPFDLMMGKLLGIGGAALTQFLVWMLSLAAVLAPGVLTSSSFLPEGQRLPSFSPAQVAWVVVFFVLGFFVYSSMYAAVGSAFNSLQEAQQMAFIPTFTIIAPMFFLFPVINDTNSTLSVVLSMVPLLAPILMPLRIAVELPPLWQIAGSALLTAGFIILMVAVCARIYRVGILMYGKKPTVKELLRWIRYA